MVFFKEVNTGTCGEIKTFQWLQVTITCMDIEFANNGLWVVMCIRFLYAINSGKKNRTISKVARRIIIVSFGTSPHVL